MKIELDEPPRVAPPEPPPLAPPRAPPPEPLTPFNLIRICPATVVILALNVLVFAIAERHGSTLRTDTLVRFGAIERSHVWAGEWWRLVSANFLHIGWVHLVWNSVMMFSLCIAIERIFGTARFAFLYLASGVGAFAVSVLGHDVVAAGASGAGFGLIGVTLVVRRRMLPNWGTFFADRGVRWNLVSMAIWTALGVTTHAMDNFAHLGGLAWGVALAWVLTMRPGRAKLESLVATVALLVATALAARHHWPWQAAQWTALEAEIAGEQALQRHDAARAITEFDRAYAAGARQPELFYDRAIAHQMLGERERAIRDYREALRVAPPNASYRQTAEEQLHALEER